MQFADRVNLIQPFHVMELLRRAKELEAQGRDIVHMELGEPDFTTPQPIIDAGIEALRRGKTHYTNALGLTELRQAIANFYAERYGVSVSPQRVIVTPGSSGALQIVMALLFNPGDGLMMADPGYPCNPNFLYMTGGEPHWVEVDAATGYQLNAGLIQAHWRDTTKAVLFASPANPTGAVMPATTIREMVAAIKDRQGVVIADEIYHGLSYGVPTPSVLQFDDNAFAINSFSKYFGMTGWRLGWVVAPEAAVPALEKLAQNLFIAPPTPSQYAALAAFEPETLAILEQRREEFRRRRDFVYDSVRALGFSAPLKPQGAFYLYAGCEAFGQDAMSLCLDLLQNQGVAITPGVDFGRNHAHSRVRFAYTTSMERLEIGMERLEIGVKRLRQGIS